MEKRKTVNGFTLVELIVVIAIIGVLAAILVPSMLGFVNKAKHSAMNASAKSLFDATMVACRENEVTKPITPGIYTSEAVYNELGSPFMCEETMNGFLYDYFADAENVRWAVRIRDDVPVGAAIQKNQNDAYMGTYPHANNQKHDTNDLICAVNFGETGTWSQTNAEENP